jgi:hypothetical protein
VQKYPENAAVTKLHHSFATKIAEIGGSKKNNKYI